MIEHKDEMDRLSYSFENVNRKRSKGITKSIVRKFNIEPIGERVEESLTESQDYLVGGKKINIELYLATYSIRAKHEGSNTLVKEIANHVSKKYNL